MIEPAAEDADVEILATRSLGDVGPAKGRVAREPTLLASLWRAQNAIRDGADDMNEVLRRFADAALDLVPGATHATIVLGQEEEGAAKQFVPVLTRVRAETSGEPAAPEGPVPLARAVWRHVLSSREAVLATDARESALASESLLGAQIRGTIGVPLWRGQELLGVLQVDDRSGGAILHEGDVELLLVLAESASLAVAGARLVRRLRAAEERLSRENAFLRTREERRGGATVIAKSRAMREVMAKIEKVADTRVTVLLTGETGGGKEVVAQTVHRLSSRRGRLFVAQNCAAMAESLLESELFGHKRGAFTGATDDKKGLFEVADGGTLFLDEVGEMPVTLQSKLLRVLQDGEIRAVGATTTKRVDVRIVAATNRDLDREVKEGRFREDLLYRLATFPVLLPPLRERREDVAPLAAAFLEQYSRELGRDAAGFSQEALELLAAYDWPGNVRELQNEVQRALLETEPGAFVTPDELTARVKGDGNARRAAPREGLLKDRLEAVERVLVAECLREQGGNKTKAAKVLGLTREGLHKKLRLLGMA